MPTDILLKLENFCWKLAFKETNRLNLGLHTYLTNHLNVVHTTHTLEHVLEKSLQ